MPQEVMRRCVCGCCRIVVTKWGGDETFPPEYAIELESNMADKRFSFWERVKAAFAIIAKRSHNHAEVVFEDEKAFAGFVSGCEDLLWKREEKDGNKE